MFYRFIIKNYKSFKEQNEFSLIPDKHKIHTAYPTTSVPVLRDAVIYGANESGKSNLIKAINFVRNLVLNNIHLLSVPNYAYKLDKETLTQPTLFVIEIRTKVFLYQYGLAISFRNSRIVEERLSRLDVHDKDLKWQSVFTRVTNDKNHTEINFNKEIVCSSNTPKYNIYKEDMKEHPDQLVLSEMSSKVLEYDGVSRSVHDVYDWIKNLIILFPESQYNLLGAVVKDVKAVNQLYQKYFKKFNIDIDEIGLTKVSGAYLNLPNDLVAQIKSDFLRNRNNRYAMLHGIGQDFVVTLDKGGNLEFSEVKFLHHSHGIKAEFTKEEESDGTKRLFDLIPMLGFIIYSDKVAIVDEIDRSLHSLLTREIFRNFLSTVGSRRHSQLICTTHDILLMDSNLIGSREVWFVDKKDGESHIYPLYQFKDSTKGKNDFRLNYILGRYRGIPQF